MAQKSNGNKKLSSAAAKSAKSSKGVAAKKAKPVAKPAAKASASEKPGKSPVKSAAKDAPKGKETAKAKDAKAKPATSKDAKPAKDVAKPKEPPKRKRKGSGVVRLKAYWGVFNQMLKRVAVFEYAERKQADKKASELSGNAKQPHFVQLVKEIIRDAE